MSTDWTFRLARVIDAVLELRAVDLPTRTDVDLVRGYFPDHS